MSVPTATELLAFLQEHEFLTPSQARQFNDGSLPKLADGRMLARELVDRSWITAYQANQLLQQRGEDLLLGPYRILDRLGAGAMGQVFKALHVNMDRLAALKIIPRDLVSNPLTLGRFYREVRAIAKLSHPNIVTAFEVNQAGRTHYLAMELVNGIDLARLVQQSGPLPIPNACEYIRQAAVGLQHAHEKGLVHRDIKPGNLMVSRLSPDEPPVIKILDFGLARFESESDHGGRLTQLGKIVGTVDYIAPEQAQNARTADIRADIYSLGCSLFYLLTGEPPFAGEDAVERISARILGDAPLVRRSRPEVSPALEQLLAKMMARNPQERYQTPGEAAKALGPYTEDERESHRRTHSISETSAAPGSKHQAVAKAPVPTVTSTDMDIASLQAIGEPKPRRRVIAPFWIALAGAVALLGILIEVIVLVSNHGANDSRKGPLLVQDRKTEVRIDPEVDLLKLIDPKKHTVTGVWKSVDGVLISSDTQGSLLALPNAVPAEYELTVRLARMMSKPSSAYFGIGIVAGKHSTIVGFRDDGWTGLEMLDGKFLHQNATSTKMGAIRDTKEHDIVCRIEGQRITVALDKQVIIDWRGDFSRLSTGILKGAPRLFLLTQEGFRFSRISIQEDRSLR